ncbi:MAG: DsbA family protein [Patescibacteria group bacterium]
MQELNPSGGSNFPKQNEPKGFFDGNPKMLFVFGCVTGIAVTLIFGGGLELPKSAAQNNEDAPKIVDTADIAGEPQVAELAPVTEADHILGDINKAKVVLVEYSDFECSYCSRHHPTMVQITEEFGDDVAWVYRHLPLTSIHPQAQPAALASECAAEQGKFWEFADEMFANQASLGDDFYEEVADNLGLDVDKFMDCYESEKYAGDVSEDETTALMAGVGGTPATFINGQLLSGAVPFDSFKDIIDSELGN